jgi:serine protease Do
MPFFSDPFRDFFFNRGKDQQVPEQQQYHQRGLGSGIIMSSDGIVLTNNHVVDDADSIYIRTYDGQRFTATVLGTDPQTDIAVIKVEAEGLPHIPVGNSDDLQVGEIVLAVGSPMSESLAFTVTQGIVSAIGRSNVGLADYEDFIQTDAAINPGNSGGPLVNLDGELVGVNTAIVSRSGGFQGIGFAVPSNMATHVMNSLVSEGKVVRGWLGVSIQDISDAIASAMNLSVTHGALVGEVVSGSPADNAGLKAGDVITSLDGHPVETTSQLRSMVASSAPGTTVDITIVRDGRNQEVHVTLGELPGEVQVASASEDVNRLLGFSVNNVTAELARQFSLDPDHSSVVVTFIDQSSNAYRAGLRQGDLIREVDRHKIDDDSDFRDAVSRKKAGDSILLWVQRDNSTFFLAFQV